MTAKDWIEKEKEKSYIEGCLRGLRLAIRMLEDDLIISDLEFATRDEFYFRAMMADYFPEDYE